MNLLTGKLNCNPVLSDNIYSLVLAIEDKYYNFGSLETIENLGIKVDIDQLIKTKKLVD